MKASAALLAWLAVASPAAAQSAPPAMGAVTVPGGKAAADGLLTALLNAPTEEAAGALETQIEGIWRNAASPAIRLLLSRGNRELGENAPKDAFDSFDAALDLDPELLDAWRGRALSRLHMGDTVGAVHDIQEVLKREPRSFAAWKDLSRIAEARGDWRSALAAWQKLLEIDPRSPGAQERLKDLRRRALGENA